MTVFYVVLAILLFGLLILVHEFGHFITAKLFGVQVNEFSLFMCPAIWNRSTGETTHSLRCIPVGGYCAMEGEDGDSENPRAFSNAKVWKRLIILVAGSFMNFLAGFLILLVLFGVTAEGFTNTKLTDIVPGRPFEDYLQPGDELVAINGEHVYVGADITMLLDRDIDGKQNITVRRNGEKLVLRDVPISRDYSDNGELRYGFTIGVDKKTVGSLLSYSWNECRDFARLVRMGLQDLFTGKAGIKDMSGPVGIVSEVSKESAKAETVGIGVQSVFILFAFIAVNLAVMNLLPIPALDGGRVVCLLVTAAAEKLLRRKINPKYEGYLHAGFMVLLLAFMAFITFKDIFQIFGG